MLNHQLIFCTRKVERAKFNKHNNVFLRYLKYYTDNVFVEEFKKSISQTVNSFKQSLQRLIFQFLIISSYSCICCSGCGGLGPNDFPKGTGFCFSKFTKFDNFESCDLLVSTGDGFFFEIFDSLPLFFRLRFPVFCATTTI